MTLRRDAFPRVPLVGAGLVLLVTLGAAAIGRPGDRGPAPPAPVAERYLGFADRPDGGIDVLEEGRVVDVVAPQTNGFLRSTLRGLARERKRRGLGPEMPFRLAAAADGSVVLEDPPTGRRIALSAFGPTNAEAFARLLPGLLPAHPAPQPPG